MKVLFVNTAPIIIYGLGAAFADSGHQVRYIFLDGEESLEKEIDNFKPDFVFNDGGIDRMNKLFPYLSDKKIPHIYWAIEDPVFTEGLAIPYARLSARVFTPCLEAMSIYQQHGIDVHLLPFACHPAYHCRGIAEERYRHDLVLVANNYNYHFGRNKGMEIILSPLLNSNYSLKVYGNEWWIDPSRQFSVRPELYGGYLPNPSLPALCASAKIILGVHSIDNSITMMSMRTFEILGCGGFFLTQWTPALENYFKNHVHLVWSKSAEETIDLVNYYYQHPELREKIAQAGQEEVYNKHTYHHRLRDIQHLFENLPHPNYPYIAPAPPDKPGMTIRSRRAVKIHR